MNAIKQQIEQTFKVKEDFKKTKKQMQTALYDDNILINNMKNKKLRDIINMNGDLKLDPRLKDLLVKIDT